MHPGLHWCAGAGLGSPVLQRRRKIERHLCSTGTGRKKRAALSPPTRRGERRAATYPVSGKSRGMAPGRPTGGEEGGNGSFIHQAGKEASDTPIGTVEKQAAAFPVGAKPRREWASPRSPAKRKGECVFRPTVTEKPAGRQTGHTGAEKKGWVAAWLCWQRKTVWGVSAARRRRKRGVDGLRFLPGQKGGEECPLPPPPILCLNRPLCIQIVFFELKTTICFLFCPL